MAQEVTLLTEADGSLKPLGDRALTDFFLPVADKVLAAFRLAAARPFVVAVSGTPGTGKSTLAAYLSWILESTADLRCASFSIDDLYFGHETRVELGSRVHPLLAVRGAPGTHDLALGHALLERLSRAEAETVTSLPRFNKLTDNPYPRDTWPLLKGQPHIIFIDSWFWNVQAATEDDLTPPWNPREAEQDPDLHWRRFVNEALRRDYSAFFERAHFWLHLAAPDWETTLRWRYDQEGDLLRQAGQAPEVSTSRQRELSWFLQTFQRWAALPHTRPPDLSIALGKDRSFQLL